MKQYWHTKDGKRIEYKKLEDSHLLNILAWIKRNAEKGVTITTGCVGWDGDEPDYWEEEIKGQDVLDEFDYENLLEEAKRRKLVLL